MLNRDKRALRMSKRSPLGLLMMLESMRLGRL